jgi:hypothetical protein
MADPTNSHDKSEKHVEPHIFLAVPLAQDEKSGVDSIFMEIPSDMVGVVARMSLPYSDEATQSGIEAQGYVSKLEMVPGSKPTLIAYIDLPEA